MTPVSLKTHTATVSKISPMAGEFCLARFALVEPKDIAFQAGQYVIFQIGPPKLRHTMSIASPPEERGVIEILQQRVPGGEGTKWFDGLKPGDGVRFVGPLGKFVMQEGSTRAKVFVATGSGIAPIRAMIIDHLRGATSVGPAARVSRDSLQFDREMSSVYPSSDDSLRSEDSSRDALARVTHPASLVLYWGLRHETDVFWKEEFEGLAVKHPNFRFLLTLSKPGDTWAGEKGRVTEHVSKDIEKLKNAEFYLCGNRAMIVDMKALLMDNGVPSEQIVTETFF